MTKSNSTATSPQGKPAKPRPDYPLFPHWNGRVGRWCKKIRGRLHYFGPWDDPDGAERRYLDQRDTLEKGVKPSDTPDGLTVLRLTVKFLQTKKAMLATDELSPRSYEDYKRTCKAMVKAMGKNTLVADLRADHFERLRNRLAKTLGPVRLGNEVNRTRVVFNYAYKSGMIDKPMVYGEGFRRPSKKTLRKHRQSQVARLFSAEEVRSMIGAAGQPLKAMILLAINGGLGNIDVATMPLSALDLDAGWLDYPRPKTAVERRVPLWPETVAALRDWLAVRPKPKSEEHAALVFVTRWGGSWATDQSSVTKETAKLLKKLSIEGRSFYALRHTLQTIGDEARDFIAVRKIMAHADGADIADAYRERVSDERLHAVADNVRGWLFAKPKPAKAAKPKAKANPSNLRIYSA